MGILGNVMSGGLLGMGGLQGAMGGQGVPQGLLDAGYDPATLRKMQIKRALVQGGAAMMSMGPSQYPVSFAQQLGTGLSAGLLGADQARDDYTQQTLLGQQLQDKKYERGRQAKQDAWTNTQNARTLQEQEEADAAKKQKRDYINKLLQSPMTGVPVQNLGQANQYRQMGDYDAAAQALMAQNGGNVEAGLNLVYWKDQQGNLHAGQPLKTGGMKEVPLPQGGAWAPGTQYLDTGTGYVPVDKRGGNVSGMQEIPKDLAGAEFQKEVGQQSGKQTAAAPGDIQAAESALNLIDQIRTSPNRERGTGWSAWGNSIPGTSGYDFQNMVDQAKSGAFLTAIQQMRGLGQLSNTEGQTATQAITRMNTATSEEAFMRALDDYEKIVRQAMARAQSRLGQQGGSSTGGPDLKSKYGLE